MKPRRAQIHLPPLSPADALLLVSVLERAIAAVWRAHGDQMAGLLAARDLVGPPPLDGQQPLPGFDAGDDLI